MQQSTNPLAPVLSKDFLSGIQAEFHVRRLPNVNYFVQRVLIPGMSLPSARQAAPSVNIPHPGDQLQFNELEVTFKVDEMMNNYFEVADWLIRLGFPRGDEHQKLTRPGTTWNGTGVKSDATIVILDNKQNARIEITVEDMFPIALSDIELDVRKGDITYLEATAKFAYSLYSFKRTNSAYAIGEEP